MEKLINLYQFLVFIGSGINDIDMTYLKAKKDKTVSGEFNFRTSKNKFKAH